MTQTRKFTLLDENSQVLCELPVFNGTIGPDVIDVQALYKNTGMFTFDPGFNSTASCASSITYIDGEEGILRYRGYPIEELAKRGSFLEVCYLLLYSELPTAEQLTAFEQNITMHTMVHDQLSGYFRYCYSNFLFL